MPRNDFVPVRERPLINKIGSGLLDGMIRAGTYGALSSERIRKIADMFRNAGQGPILRAQPVNPQGYYPPQQGPILRAQPVNPAQAQQWWDAYSGKLTPAPPTPDDEEAPSRSIFAPGGYATPRYGVGGGTAGGGRFGGERGYGDASMGSAGFGGGGHFGYAPGGGGRISQLIRYLIR